MKQLFLLFLIFFTTDSFASGIASNTASAPCTNTTLETYSGNSNLAADWQPNEIQLRWYSMNTQITPTNTTANTCVYDGSLAIPQNAPTRTGYTFAGWTVVPEYDFSTLPTDITGQYAWSRNFLGSEAYGVKSPCWYGPVPENPLGTLPTPCDNGDFDDIDVWEWKTQFEYGMVYGVSLCSSVSGDVPDESSYGPYCYCKVTGFIPTGGNIKYAPLKSPEWYYFRTLEGAVCYAGCADYCSYYLRRYEDYRKALFK